MSLIEKIDDMTDCLYQHKLDQGYVILNQNMNDMGKILGEIITDAKSEKIDINRVLEAMKMASNAMEVNDPVLIADLFHYEIRPELKKL